MLMMIIVITRKEVKHKSVKIQRIVLDCGVIVDSRMVVLFEYE